MNMKPYKNLKIRNEIECPFGYIDIRAFNSECIKCDYYYKDDYIVNCFLHDLRAYLMYRAEVDNGS